jgi:hypothetical protein
MYYDFGYWGCSDSIIHHYSAGFFAVGIGDIPSFGSYAVYAFGLCFVRAGGQGRIVNGFCVKRYCFSRHDRFVLDAVGLNCWRRDYW